MPLGNVSRLLSNYLNSGSVSSLNNFLGFSTLTGNSSRSYIRNFWNKPTAMPAPGHMHQNKRLDGNNKNLYIKLWGGHRNWRPSEVRRLRKRSYETKMQYKTGREFIMWNMIRGKSKYAEYF